MTRSTRPARARLLVRPLVRPLVRTAGGLVAAALAASTVALGGVTAPAASAAAATVTPAGGCAVAASPTWSSALRTVAPHPRIVYGSADVAGIAATAKDPVLAPYHRRFLGWASTASRQPVPVYDAKRLASIGQESNGRIRSLGFGYLATKDTAYVDRIRKEVAALVAFPDWGTGSFLDTSETAIAVSMGYSLAAARMSAEEKARTLDALESRALARGSCLWRSGDRMVAATDNWGVISNSAMAMAALAVADRDAPVAAAALGRALPLANRALATLSDGGTGEGPGYAGYLGRSAAYLSASMHRSFGAAGTAAVTRVKWGARYFAGVEGPSGGSFNYSDTSEGTAESLLPTWEAYLGGDRLGAWTTRRRLAAGTSSPLDLVWQSGPGTPPERVMAPATAFRSSGVSTMRSGWTPTSTWVALKGGSNAVSHSQLELGGFVLEMLGQRFVSDYGKDSYSLPGYFHLRYRGDWFRNSTAGASTISVPGRNQAWTATAPLAAPVRDADGTWRTSVALTAATGLRSALRSVRLDPQRRVILTDQVTSTSPTALQWRVHTKAAVTLSADRRTAELSLGGRVVRMALSYRSKGAFRVVAPPVVSGGYDNSAFRIVQLDTATVRSGSAAALETSVVFTPMR